MKSYESNLKFYANRYNFLIALLKINSASTLLTMQFIPVKWSIYIQLNIYINKGNRELKINVNQSLLTVIIHSLHANVIGIYL